MSDNELASSADEGSDAEKAEALNAKVQRVMAPLMKKMAKQAKKIASLEDALARQGKNAKSEIPQLKQSLDAHRRATEEALASLRAEPEDRPRHSEIARVEDMRTCSPRTCCVPCCRSGRCISLLRSFT